MLAGSQAKEHAREKRICWSAWGGFRPPFEKCGHRHRSLSRARQCAEPVPQAHDAVRLVATRDGDVVHVEYRDGGRVPGEPWAPELVRAATQRSPGVVP